MFGCLKPFFSDSVVPTDLENQPNAADSLVGVALKRIHGKWMPRLAELTLENKLVLWKTITETRTYRLTGLKKIVLGAGKNSLHAKMTLFDGEKLYLKMKGPNLDRWAKRMTEIKFPAKQRPPLTPVPRPMPVLRLPVINEIFPESPGITSSITEISLPSAHLVNSSPKKEEPKKEEEEEEEEEENGLVVRMARRFEPDYPKKGTLRLPKK